MTSTIQWQKDVSLASYSTYKIGGRAKYFAKVKSLKQAIEAIQFCKEKSCSYYVLGKGSNTLFDDRGYGGAVILNEIEFVEVDANVIYAGSGSSLPKLSRASAKLGLSGLEFGIGIPGTLGGALYMNAGAQGQEIKDVIQSVEYIDEERGLVKLERNSINFDYRVSSLQNLKGMVYAAHLELKTSPHAKAVQKEYLKKRQRTQPLKAPSCGCVFRNPNSIAAGALIDELGLKGKKIGGAEVSSMHANFIVNANSASAKDVLELTELIEKMAYEKRGIKLQRELRFIPYEGSA